MARSEVITLVIAMRFRLWADMQIWETDFYTPRVLGGAALFDNSAPAVYKIEGPWGTGFYTPLPLNCRKGQHLPAPVVYKNQSPKTPTRKPRHANVFGTHSNTQAVSALVADVWGEGRLGVPGQVWEFRFLLSFPIFPRENRSSRNVWENAWKAQTSFFQTPTAF